MTTEFRGASIEDGVKTKGNARNLIWLLFQENPDASYSEVAKKIGVSDAGGEGIGDADEKGGVK